MDAERLGFVQVVEIDTFLCIALFKLQNISKASVS